MADVVSVITGSCWDDVKSGGDPPGGYIVFIGRLVVDILLGEVEVPSDENKESASLAVDGFCDTDTSLGVSILLGVDDAFCGVEVCS